MSSMSECAVACGVVVVDKSMTELTYDSGNFLIGEVLPEHSIVPISLSPVIATIFMI
jgi:hypothetical protein